MIQLFKQRDFGEKINVTFQYVSENYRTLGMALLYIVGPVAVVAGIASGVAQSNILRLSTESAGGQPADPMAAFRLMAQFMSPTFWLAGLFGLLANVAVILTTYAHMRGYERKNGLPISVANVWAEVQPVIGRGIVISLLGSIITGVAMLFLVIPGIYIAVVLSLALAVTSFEGTTFGQTWDRCFKLIRDKWWSTFGLIVVTSIIVSVIGLVFALPSGLVALLVGAKILPDVSTVWLVIANVIAIIGRTLLNAVIYLAIGFQYTNLVERQEGRGLISAIDSIGTPIEPRTRDEGE